MKMAFFRRGTSQCSSFSTSTMPQGYWRPWTTLPLTLYSFSLPTIAKGMRVCKNDFQDESHATAYLEVVVLVHDLVVHVRCVGEVKDGDGVFFNLLFDLCIYDN